jgi:hypothetical protein
MGPRESMAIARAARGISHDSINKMNSEEKKISNDRLTNRNDLLFTA